MILFLAKDDDGSIWGYREKPYMSAGRWYGGVVAQIPNKFLNEYEHKELALGKIVRADVTFAVVLVSEKQIVK